MAAARRGRGSVPSAEGARPEGGGRRELTTAVDLLCDPGR